MHSKEVNANQPVWSEVTAGLRDPEVEVRRAALEAFVELGGTNADAQEAFQEMFISDPDSKLRQLARSAAYIMGGD